MTHPNTHHLDRRAHQLIDAGAGPDDDLLSTRDLADWLGMSTQWVEIARHKGIGPRWCAPSPRRIRYRRSDVMAWLEERSHQCTREKPADAAD